MGPSSEDGMMRTQCQVAPKPVQKHREVCVNITRQHRNMETTGIGVVRCLPLYPVTSCVLGFGQRARHREKGKSLGGEGKGAGDGVYVCHD